MKRTGSTLSPYQLCDLASSHTSLSTLVFIGPLILATILCLCALRLPAQTLTTLHSFSGAPGDGATPFAGVIADGAGNLYGTTAFGGSSNSGTVFKIDPSGNESVMHVFTGGEDGANPVAGLTLDSAGNLYGTTASGGQSSNCRGGCGTVFKLDPSGNETLLYNFTAINGDGWDPGGELVLDSSGNIFGTTEEGGSACQSCGIVFKLDSTGQETILLSFNYFDGQSPQGGLLRDANGNLYGFAAAGGAYTYYGGIFEVDGSNNETFYSFSGPDGEGFGGTLILDSSGNLYGTTFHGGTGGCFEACGVVFKFDPSGNETVLHSFTAGEDGAFPTGLVMDSQGNLYGSTYAGGANNFGVIFKIDSAGNESVLYSFTSTDGQNPQGNIVLDAAGNLYGTTANGGQYGHGTVFKLATVVDTTPPTIQCASPDNLWHPTDVTINCTASDSGSGLANSADASFSLVTSVPVGTETTNASTGTRSVCDKAGNCATAGPISGFKIDKKAPSITLTTPSNAGTYILNQSVIAIYACSDAGSGVASCTGTVASGSAINTKTAGSNSFQISAADNVGNQSVSSSTYQVQYQSVGTLCLGSPGHDILPPINVDGSSVFKQGSTVPAKFRVCDSNGASIGTAGTIISFQLVQIISGTASQTVDEPVDSNTPDSAFRWDPINQQWIFNISTKSLAAGSTYGFLVTLNDGTMIGFAFGLR